MKKLDMLETMVQTEQEMRPVLEILKIKGTPLHVPEDAILLKGDVILGGYNWLMKIVKTEWADYLSIRRLLPTEIWERYIQWEGFENRREVLLLNERYKKLRSAIVSQKRPDFYKKGRVNALIKKRKKTGGKRASTKAASANSAGKR